MTVYKHPPPPQKYLMEHVNCTSKEESIWKCPIVEADETACTNDFVAVECSGTVRLSLNLNEQYNKCAGVVEFSTPDGIIGVCNDKWDHERLRLQNGSHLCSGLVEKYSVTKSSEVLQQTNVMPEDICSQLNCGSNGNFTNHNGTNILTCSDTVKLRNFTKKCFGAVSIDVNGTNYRVCYRDLTLSLRMGAVVCRELGCGKVLHVQENQFLNDLMINVECQGDEKSLWHCLVNRETKQCMGTKVICSDSLDVHLSDGLGRCSGRVEVQWEGSWWTIGSGWTTENSDVVCQHLSCGTSNRTTTKHFIPVNQQQLKSSKNCKSSSAKLHECFVETSTEPPFKPSSQKEQDTNIICKKEELLSFEGDLPCQGRVRIESIDGETRWLLMGENNTKASNICHVMQCGSLKSFVPAQNMTHANVTCSGSVSVKLSKGCWGTVEVCREEQVGERECGEICSYTWRTKEDSNMICGNLGCGTPIPGQLTHQINSPNVSYYSVYCSENVKHMSMCNFIPKKNFICNIPAQVICTDWERLLLYKKEGECSGPVYGFRNGKTQLVREQEWGLKEGQKLCEYLQCGNYTSHSTRDIHDNTTEWWNKTYNCSGTENMLECESRDQPVQGQRQLSIQCDRKPPAITLSNNCTGKVLINKEHVSASQWLDKMSDNLCNNLGCGNAIQHWSVKTDTKKCWHFSCTGLETSVWQCGSKKDNCENILSVACKNSVKFSSTEKCGGKLGIKYKGQWEYVCGKLTDTDAGKVCNVLQCKDNQELLNEQEIVKEIKVNIKCPESHQNIFQCVNLLKNPECSLGYADIKCEGYSPKVGISSVRLVLGLLGGMLGLLILFLMIRNRKRLLLALSHYRNKNGKDMNTDMNEMDKMDAENRDNDEYEDVDSLMEKSGEEDEDDRKRDSSGTEYDDIEGQANGISPSQTHHDDNVNLPLLPKRPENILGHL
uniref:Si:dkey-8e10.2 n=1 Tax=Cyprinus carpio carpio TaxID=630221 RepID=A0A9J7WY93_CYPCA